MAEKKGFWATLFGGGCDCGMEVEEAVAPKKKDQKRWLLRYADFRGR